MAEDIPVGTVLRWDEPESPPQGGGPTRRFEDPARAQAILAARREALSGEPPAPELAAGALLALALLAGGGLYLLTREGASGEGYRGDAANEALRNQAFRRVLYTGDRLQLVAMSLPPGSDIGLERHPRVEQLLLGIAGRGRSVVDGVSLPFGPGNIVAVAPGQVHDLEAGRRERLQLLSVYAPPNHLPGTTHLTKRDAEQDLEDEAYSTTV